ncbi:glycine oxidase ThiO [Stutzerimonas urumqiensis]
MGQLTLVIGGGVMGLLTSLHLADAGAEVVLFDQGQVGREASWAGGGIVSPLYPWRYSPAVTALAHWSQEYYPALGERLLGETGVDPEVTATGLYWLDLDDESEALAWAQCEGRTLRAVPIEQAYAAVPGLGAGYQRAVYMPEIANVRNPRLLKALRQALAERPNVELVEGCAVRGITTANGRVVGVETEQGQRRADRVVVAAGAWSGQLLASLGLEVPVEPVKGEMILYKAERNWLGSMVLAKGRYAIPRRDGHILVGSTLARTGFDKQPTQTALDSLKATAQTLLPALTGAEVVQHWAGLRPGSPDGVPYIGELSGVEGLWLNCGHYRNGLVLAPASCRLLVDLMLGESPIIDPTPYAPADRLAARA